MSLVYGIGGLINVPPPVLQGNGAPSANFKGQLGQSYFDKSTSPFTEYIYNGTSWEVGGSSSGNEFHGNTGVAVPSGGVVNIVGSDSIQTSASGDTVTITSSVSGFPITPYVVGPVGQAGYQTIMDAVLAAQDVGYGTIYIQQGSYTEDLFFVGAANFDFVGLGVVTITGRHRCGNATNLTFTNISFISSSDVFYTTNPFGTATITSTGCNFSCNGYIYNLPVWIDGGHLNLINCTDQGSTLNNVINGVGGASVEIKGCNFLADGTLFPCAGFATIFDSTFAMPVTLGATLDCAQSNFEVSLTCNTIAIGNIRDCVITAPVTGPALTVSSGVNRVNVINSTINSPTSPAIDGTGTISLQDVVFLNNSTVAGTLTVTSFTDQTGPLRVTGSVTTTNGNLVLGTAGNKLSIATGANASVGTATLAGGTVTVNTTAVTASSIIILTRQSVGATGAAATGNLTIGTVTAGTSFVINAVQAADATALQASDVSVIGWMIIN